MASIYYCTDAQLTDLLPDLTDSEIDTSAKRDIKLRAPAREWVDSIYPDVAPFPNIAAAGEEWLINSTSHAAGDTSVNIDGGTNVPVVGDWFRVEYQNVWYKVTAYSAPLLTYVSNPPRWTLAARAEWPDDARIFFGTPVLIQEAAAWYGVSIGFSIIRRSPSDEAAKAAIERAKDILGVAAGGVAAKAPFPRTEWADDVKLSNEMRPGQIKLQR
jgi:hypothetical protein|tara:strand:- start:4835 stop:5479 length:645 start_codon:yes stop_codon:yes gene_type:complete